MAPLRIGRASSEVGSAHGQTPQLNLELNAGVKRTRSWCSGRDRILDMGSTPRVVSDGPFAPPSGSTELKEAQGHSRISDCNALDALPATGSS